MPAGPTLWLDVEDLFDYAEQYTRPSGVQRMALEIAAALHAADPARIRCVRHLPDGTGFAEIPYARLAALFPPIPPGQPPSARIRTATPLVLDAPIRVLTGWPRLRRRLAMFLAPELRLPLGRFRRSQTEALRELLATIRGLRLWLTRPPERARLPLAPLPPGAMQPGDVLLALGSPWGFPDYPARLAALRSAGIRLASFVHDVIPLRHPQWCDATTASGFRAWFIGAVPLMDLLLVASRATAADISHFAARLALPTLGRIAPLPIGAGFTLPPEQPFPHLPTPGTYALCVGTIEPRKNHALLLRLWQTLLETRPRAAVPRLVFAGRPGWMVADMMQQLENCAFLDGHVLIVESASDAELAALYRGCRFTLYPSFYEGWGLPVVESLAFGKPCLAARATSLPEAGGPLARYFDPDDLHNALAALTPLIDDPSVLPAWTAEIAANFRPTPWSATAHALFAAIDAPIDAPPDEAPQ